MNSAADKVLSSDLELDPVARKLGSPTRPASLAAGLNRRVETTPENVERGLARLVLTLIELLRQLMERQALRRIEGGSLSEEEVERLGQTFMLLERRMEELKGVFGLEDQDLNLNLGPLGDLL